MTIKVDYSNAFIKKEEVDNILELVGLSHDLVHGKKGQARII